ncbi:hypothetical protein ACVWXM_002483 [Bradyrhizobium sp. GM7.3]
MVAPPFARSGDRHMCLKTQCPTKLVTVEPKCPLRSRKHVGSDDRPRQMPNMHPPVRRCKARQNEARARRLGRGFDAFVNGLPVFPPSISHDQEFRPFVLDKMGSERRHQQHVSGAELFGRERPVAIGDRAGAGEHEQHLVVGVAIQARGLATLEGKFRGPKMACHDVIAQLSHHSSSSSARRDNIDGSMSTG